MARAQERKRVQSPHWSRQRVQKLSPMFVASFETPAANAGGTTFNLKVPGSSPGRALAGT
jgi:hypothetical protein